MKQQESQSLTVDQIDVLKNLLKLNLDSVEGCNAANEITEDKTIKGTLGQIISQRGRIASEIKVILKRYGHITEDDDISMGTVRRWWMQLKNSVSTLDNYAILAEAERSEDAIKEAYEESVGVFKYTDLASTIQRHCSEVVTMHNRIREMRDKAKG